MIGQLACCTADTSDFAGGLANERRCPWLCWPSKTTTPRGQAHETDRRSSRRSRWYLVSVCPPRGCVRRSRLDLQCALVVWAPAGRRERTHGLGRSIRLHFAARSRLSNPVFAPAYGTGSWCARYSAPGVYPADQARDAVLDHGGRTGRRWTDPPLPIINVESRQACVTERARPVTGKTNAPAGAP